MSPELYAYLMGILIGFAGGLYFGVIHTRMHYGRRYLDLKRACEKTLQEAGLLKGEIDDTPRRD